MPNQLATQMLAGKQMLQGQSNYMPSTTNQTLVIGQLGVLPSQASMIPAHAKQVAESQKVRPYVSIVLVSFLLCSQEVIN